MVVMFHFLNNLFTSVGTIEKHLEQPVLDLKATFAAPSTTSKLEKFVNIRWIKLELDGGETLVMAVHLPQLAEAEKDSENDKIKVEGKSGDATDDIKNTSAPKTGTNPGNTFLPAGTVTPPAPKVSQGH